jgi:hypothetical protein
MSLLRKITSLLLALILEGIILMRTCKISTIITKAALLADRF